MIRRPYYGWSVVLVAAAAMVGTLPARTQGLGLVTEHILSDFEIDRVTWAEINLWATLGGAGCAIVLGRLLDRYGARVVLTTTLLALGVIVALMSGATTIVAMLVLVTLTRGIGQSALSVASMIAPSAAFFKKKIEGAPDGRTPEGTAVAGPERCRKTRLAGDLSDAYPPMRSGPRRSPSACPENLLKIDPRSPRRRTAAASPARPDRPAAAPRRTARP